MLNRLRDPQFPKTVCDVVFQGAKGAGCQFTFTCDGALDHPPTQDGWDRARKVAVAALHGYVMRQVGAATHYHADYVAPRWAPLLAKVAQIGQHIFYRWPGAWGQPAAFTGRYIGEPRDPLS
ncbi:cell wall hydrolase, partial [Phenylobacterium sp.]|uniref:cell wall hydrolase n=1 Tax=Phenylobacterium sp. TaxID=1871053 RepID=UPI0039C9BBC1